MRTHGTLLLAALILCAGARGIGAAPRDFAAGLSLGSPTGLSVLQNLDSTSAVQAALEWGSDKPFTVQADYLFKVNGLFAIPPEEGRLQLYYGPGLRLEAGSRRITFFGPYRTSRGGRLGLRFPVGLQYYLPRIPFDIFAEAAPMLTLWRSTQPDMTWALGLRFNL